jgi:protein TonB
VKTGYLALGSLVAHLGGFALISRKAHEIEQKQTLIQVVEQQKKEEEKKAEPKPLPIEAPASVLAPAPKAAEPPPAAEEPAVNDQPSAAMQALPDYGLKMGNGPAAFGNGDGTGTGGAGGGHGDAGAPSTAPGKPVEKTLAPPTPAAGGDLSAEIAAWKPKPTARVKPVYPDEARSSEIEGTVTVEAIIDCTGKVKSATLVKGLGHGLDDAALTAVKKTEFSPAPRCVAGFEKPMKINYAFRLGD